MDGITDRLLQVGANSHDVDLVAEALGERRGRPIGIEPGAIEASVDDRLDPLSQRLEERGDDQGGQRDRDRVAAGHAGQRATDDDDQPGVGGDERGRDRHVGDRAADDPIDLEQPVAEHSHDDRDGHRGSAAPPG